MHYRALGKTGHVVGEIGMGLEHLLDKDEATVTATIRAAIEGGATYFDCHPGHDFDDESIAYAGYEKLGRAIRGERDNLCLSYLATHKSRSVGEAAPRFESYLKALGTDHTDVFIIQFCDKADDFEQAAGEGGILAHAIKLKEEKMIGAIGISTHSSEIAYKAIVNGSFDVLMYPVNPAFDVVTDGEHYKTEDIGTLWDAAYEYKDGGDNRRLRKNIYIECERAGVGLIAMKPFAGGFIFEIEKDAGFTPVNLISYVLAQSGVSAVVPGCTCPEEIKGILKYYGSGEGERDYAAAVAKSRWSAVGNCLYCEHCQPCRAGIDIAAVNRLLDEYDYRGADIEMLKIKYCAARHQAAACVKCGDCALRCPFGVDVIGGMNRAAGIFGEENDE